ARRKMTTQRGRLRWIRLGRFETKARSRRIALSCFPIFPMTDRSGGEILVASLLAQGATHAFGVPGESYLAVLDALHDVGARLPFFVCRNEGGAAYMAEAF